jgi:hypothetical protein
MMYPYSRLLKAKSFISRLKSSVQKRIGLENKNTIGIGIGIRIVTEHFPWVLKLIHVRMCLGQVLRIGGREMAASSAALLTNDVPFPLGTDPGRTSYTGPPYL